MKRQLCVLICTAMLMAPTLSNAELYLVDNGDGPVVVDTARNRTWLADLGLSGQVTWSGGNEWVANLNSANYHGYSTWRMPSLGRLEDVWIGAMGNVMWNPPNRLPFLNVPTTGILWSSWLVEGDPSCVGNEWGEWIPCVWAFQLGFNGLIYANPLQCYWDSCIATALHPGLEPVTPSGLFAGLALAMEYVGPGTSLPAKLEVAKAYYDANDIGATCPALASFKHEVTAQAGKQITSYDAQWFQTEVQGLMDRIGCAGGAATVNQCYPVQAVRDHLAHWWPGDETAIDIIGNSPGTLRGNASTGFGLVGRAFTFDGDGDFVDVPDDGLMDFGQQDFTVSLWVRFNLDWNAGEQVLIEKWVQTYDAPSTGWTLTKLPDGVILLAMGAQGAYEEIGISSEPMDIQPNVWMHVAIRREANEFSILVNGQRVAAGTVDPTVPFDLRAYSSLKIGHRGTPDDTPGSQESGPGFFLNGRVDEVQMFIGRALSDGQIRAIYLAGSRGVCKE